MQHIAQAEANATRCTTPWRAGRVAVLLAMGAGLLMGCGQRPEPAPPPTATPRPAGPTVLPPAPTATPAPPHAQFKTVDLGGNVKLDLAWIPAGSFVMGSPAAEGGRDEDETQHEVTLTKGFWIGQYEVTQAQWQQVMGSNPSSAKKGGDFPVESVSWVMAADFIAKLNALQAARKDAARFRLPTEAEWEYACRAGTTTALYTGEGSSALNMAGWYIENSSNALQRTALKKPNAWALYDMPGNAWEWCADFYEAYPAGPVTDPAGPAAGQFHVSRGGSWRQDSVECRAASRSKFKPEFRWNDAGLRLVLDEP